VTMTLSSVIVRRCFQLIVLRGEVRRSLRIFGCASLVAETLLLRYSEVTDLLITNW
jgi:hypothetical protein